MKKCAVVNVPNVMPGWGCCQCRTYNGEQRKECKNCKHPRCDHEEEQQDKSKLN